MSDNKNFLLPLVIDILSHKPNLCEAQNRLLSAVGRRLGNDEPSFENLKKQFDSTIDMGRDLGILSVRQEDVVLPLMLKNAKLVYKKKRNARRSKKQSNVDNLAHSSRVRSRTMLSDSRKGTTLRNTIRQVAERKAKLNRH